MSFRILSFTEKHLEDAAKLFTRRYKEMRSKSAILPSQYEKQDLILPLLRNLVDNEDSHCGVSKLRKWGLTSSLTLTGSAKLLRCLRRSEPEPNLHTYPQNPDSDCVAIKLDKCSLK
jgi:hypothetical protein